jgi:alcohol dehydrogenase class IV
MKAFTFQAPPNILFEAGASHKLAETVTACGVERVLLVTDKGVRNASLTKGAETSLAKNGCTLTVFDEVEADPPSHVIERAITLCRDNRIELVASIGGGSALDTAKLVAYLAKTPDRLDDIYGVGLAKGERLPLLLVPTTAGTGSEVTPIAIVTTPTTEKKGVVSPRLLPDWAILDPALTLGLPPHVTAATGIDAMVHAIEAYTSKHKKNPPVRHYRCCRPTYAQSAPMARTSKRGLRCCLGRCWPAWHSPMRRSRRCTRWPIRSGRFSTCRTGCRTHWS